MQKLIITKQRSLYQTDIPDNYNLKSEYYWMKILSDLTPNLNFNRDYFSVVTDKEYDHSYKNKMHHFILDDSINWSYHFFHLFNHKTFELYDLIPEKITTHRHFQTLYKREIKKSFQLQPTTFINYNEINKL